MQGAARIRLDDGTSIRVTYAGKTGHPYTAIGRVLLDMGTLEKGAVIGALRLYLDFINLFFFLLRLTGGRR